jgi:hypothetical protein
MLNSIMLLVNGWYAYDICGHQYCITGFLIQNQLYPEGVFFFLHVHTRVGRGIRTCDPCFIRYGSQPIELPLGNSTHKELRAWIDRV